MSQFKPDTYQFIVYASRLLNAIKRTSTLKELRRLQPSVNRLMVSTALYHEIPDLRLEVLNSYREAFLAYV